MIHLPNLLRSRASHARVTNVELFFDLVFVFAVTQLSHTLLQHLSLAGALQTGFLLLAVWWVWVYTCWFTNWIDPDKPSVRVLLFVLMLAGLLMSAAIPHAFEREGLLFAGAYVFIQLVRTGFMLHALREHDRANYLNFLRIFAWLCVSGALWLAGGFSADGVRAAFWIAALALEIGGPTVGFFTPGLGRSSTADWKVDGTHTAERCSLFVIIALGESILVTGATAADHPATTTAVCAFVVAFLGSVAMWWIYFNIGAERGSHHIAHSDDPGRMARAVYTYFHIPIIAGIVVCAVADELTIAHPDGHVGLADAFVLLGGPVLYLLGNLYFKRASANNFPLSHLVGLGLLVVTAPFATMLTPLALGAATSAILVLVAVWETRSFAAGARA
ncbi:MAG TPA: low temperature requirement protein A [Steroidobacteraceae bacterium]|nr:low temperature requirement protein A [Steroidobacteraceae bacterium]